MSSIISPTIISIVSSPRYLASATESMASNPGLLDDLGQSWDVFGDPPGRTESFRCLGVQSSQI